MKQPPQQKSANRPKERSWPLHVRIYEESLFSSVTKNFISKGLPTAHLLLARTELSSTIPRRSNGTLRQWPRRGSIRSEFLTLYLRPRCLIRRIGMDYA